MQGMALHIGWEDIFIRLVLSLVAGALIGLDRNEHGKPAGLRTTTLVCLAASVAMIQTNILLPTAGKSASSFVTLDLMRLPLGILSGVGFLGAGAIIRRSDRVLGITTAATLWIVTVIGLCFGGGQLGLGSLTTLLALLVLWSFKAVERRMRQEHQGFLNLVSRNNRPHDDIAALLKANTIHIANQAIKYSDQGQMAEARYELHWKTKKGDTRPPVFLETLARDPSLLSIEWAPRGTTEF